MVSSHGDDPSSGGVERLLRDLTGVLSGRGIHVAYLQAFPQRGGVGELERTVLHRTDWRDDRSRRLKNHVGDVLSARRGDLETAIRSHRPDVVHTHNLPGIGTVVWDVCRRLGLPVVHSLHDYYLLCPRVTLMSRDGDPCRPSPLLCGMRTRLMARWASAVSQVIGVSQYVLDVHRHLFTVAHLQVVRHPLDASSSAGLRAPRGRPEVVGYIGSLERIKGVQLLLEAAPRIEESGLTLRIAGDGSLRDDVTAAAARSTDVIWDGPVTGEQKRRFFEGCDFGIVPSVWAEPGGPTFTMVEWLAAGRPVLVSSRGGLGEVGGRYPGSSTVEPTVDSIVRSVQTMIEPGRWNEAVAGARRGGEGKDLEEWGAEHERIYRSVARGQPGTGGRVTSVEARCAG
jgi:glycosyltransferase involved in cell wall biosynthesis